MMNPLYYAEMIGWQKYSNFAYPGEIPGTQPQPKKFNVAADQYAKYYMTLQGGEYQYYYDYYVKTYGEQPLMTHYQAKKVEESKD